LILAFVVFNPGDLYYLGYKKNNNSIKQNGLFLTTYVVETEAAAAAAARIRQCHWSTVGR